jgi:hypothetical protein
MRCVVVHSNKTSMVITLQRALNIGRKRGSFMENQWEELWHFSFIESSLIIGVELFLLRLCARYHLYNISHGMVEY